MTPKLGLFSALLCIGAFATVVGAGRCGGVCRFNLCLPITKKAAFNTRKISLLPPGVAGFSPLICLKNFKDSMGFVLKTGEPIVIPANLKEFPMSRWKPRGLKPRFPEKYFRAKKIPVQGKSGIERIESKGNQWKFLAGICVKLPIVSYQKVNPRSGKVQEVIRTERNPDDCVSFSTRLTKILIVLTWEGKEDLDLKVTEPNGDFIDRFKRKSKSGNFVTDQGKEQCSSERKASRELAVYRENNPRIQRGEYRVDVFHFSRCGRKPTKWNLRVAFSGDQELFHSYVSNDVNEGFPIFTTTFKYP